MNDRTVIERAPIELPVLPGIEEALWHRSSWMFAQNSWAVNEMLVGGAAASRAGSVLWSRVALR